MDTLERPPDGDRDRGPLVMAVYGTTLVLATFIMSLRIYARYQRRALGIDDWTMLLSVVSIDLPCQYQSGEMKLIQ